MVSDLTVIKHNHPKSKYPTHDSGMTWQPGVHLPVLTCSSFQTYVGNKSIVASMTFKDFLATGQKHLFPTYSIGVFVSTNIGSSIPA